MKKFVIYTAIFGEPGRFNIPEISLPDVDKFCFTDFKIKGGCHQMIPIRKGLQMKNDFYDMKITDLGNMTPVMRQRFIKICIPDEIFDNYEFSAYVDCKRGNAIDFKQCEKLLNARPRSHFLTREHPERNCVYAEGRKCIEVKKGNKADIRKQKNFYKSEGYPTGNGLYYTTWVFRRHTKKLREFSKLWWGQLNLYSHRDQVSLPYVAWKHNFKITKFVRPE